MNPPGLIALSPGELDARAAQAWLSVAHVLFEAGWRGLVLRELRLGDREFAAWARRVREQWLRERGGWLCVHDRAHLAEELDADSVQLGGASLAPSEVRPWLRAGVAIGLSTHAEDASERWREADWIVHGPVQRTDKPGARPPIGFEGLRRAVERSPVPVWALGGLAPEHAHAVAKSGASGMAVLSGLVRASDPAAVAAAYVREWTSARGA